MEDSLPVHLKIIGLSPDRCGGIWASTIGNWLHQKSLPTERYLPQFSEYRSYTSNQTLFVPGHLMTKIEVFLWSFDWIYQNTVYNKASDHSYWSWLWASFLVSSALTAWTCPLTKASSSWRRSSSLPSRKPKDLAKNRGSSHLVFPSSSHRWLFSQIKQTRSCTR